MDPDPLSFAPCGRFLHISQPYFKTVFFFAFTIVCGSQCLVFYTVFIKVIVMEIEKGLINDRLCVSEVFWKFLIPTILILQ